MVIDNQELDRYDLADGQLAARAADGDTAAFEVLYRRHANAAWRVAQAVAGNADDAADAVSEAFTRLLHAMAEGRVAAGAPFRPYLLVTTRNAAIDILRRRNRIQPIDGDIDLRELPAASPAGPSDRLVQSVDAALVGAAFRSLPERWRSVLWLTEVEGMPVREVGEHLGLTANGAAQLAHRARNGLRERFLQAHLRASQDEGCQDTISQLGAYAAGALGPRAVAKVDQHLAGCEACRTRLAEVEDVESSLRRILLPLPLLLGPAALEHFKASLTSASHFAHSVLLGGPRTARLSQAVRRPLSTMTAGLLALGVIAAAVMGESAGIPPVAASRPKGLTPPGGPTVATITPAATVTPIGESGTLASGGPSGQGTLTGLTPTTVLPPPPPPPPPHPTTTTTVTTPFVQVAAGANAGGQTASASASIGGCTAVSINGSTSCAPEAPSQTGVQVSATTPLGTTTIP